MPSVVRVVGAVLQEVRLLFSSVGRGRGAGVGVNDVLAHLPNPLTGNRLQLAEKQLQVGVCGVDGVHQYQHQGAVVENPPTPFALSPLLKGLRG